MSNESVQLIYPSDEMVKNAAVSGMDAYRALCAEADADYPEFWAKRAREIGRIEARLSYPQPKTVSSAPPPIGGVKGGGSSTSPAIGADMSAYERWRNGK